MSTPLDGKKRVHELLEGVADEDRMVTLKYIERHADKCQGEAAGMSSKWYHYYTDMLMEARRLIAL